MVHIVMFEPELIALRKEIQYHPALLLILGQQTDPDIYVHIAEIATYCGIILDGTYSREDMIKLCELLTKTLYEKRSILVLPMLPKDVPPIH